jgi:hypothetical protein
MCEVDIQFEGQQWVTAFRRAVQSALPKLRIRDFHLQARGHVVESGPLSSHSLTSGDEVLLIRKDFRNTDLHGSWRDVPKPMVTEPQTTARRARRHSITRYGKSRPCSDLPLFML